MPFDLTNEYLVPKTSHVDRKGTGLHASEISNSVFFAFLFKDRKTQIGCTLTVAIVFYAKVSKFKDSQPTQGFELTESVSGD